MVPTTAYEDIFSNLGGTKQEGLGCDLACSIMALELCKQST